MEGGAAGEVEHVGTECASGATGSLLGRESAVGIDLMLEPGEERSSGA
jgi:hypothetical protein